MLKTGQTYRHHHAKHYSPHSFGSLLDVQCWARIFLPQWTKTPRKKQKNICIYNSYNCPFNLHPRHTTYKKMITLKNFLAWVSMDSK